jgi:hypothetical protein
MRIDTSLSPGTGVFSMSDDQSTSSGGAAKEMWYPKSKFKIEFLLTTRTV